MNLAIHFRTKCIQLFCKAFSSIQKCRNASLCFLQSVPIRLITFTSSTKRFSDTDGETELSVPGVVLWEQSIKKLKDVLRQMGSEHRDMHSGVSKCGKEIDKVQFWHVWKRMESRDRKTEDSKCRGMGPLSGVGSVSKVVMQISLAWLQFKKR